MSEKKNNSNNDLSREKINEELDKVKNEEKSKTGVLGSLSKPWIVSCYTVCPPPLPFRIWQAIFGKFNKKTKICPNCRVELQADTVKKNELRCPKCGKRFINSDLSDSN